jgi:predicted nucleic acid-binding protein
MAGKALVVDANILIRAVLGQRVRGLIEAYAGQVSFFVPESAFKEAEEHLPALAARHDGDPHKVLAVLHSLAIFIEVLGSDVYDAFEMDARERLGNRDPQDWPILASALAFGCPIWTEDSDFFGCGVPTWTSGRVEIFLRGTGKPEAR